MARPLRLSYAGAVYHVTARGNERKPIVRDDTDRARFVDTLGAMVAQYRVVCHAWVLMNNHYHLLLETPSPNLSLAVRHLNGVYTQAFNRRHRRVGHLFQGRFKAIVIEKEAYLLELCRYVVLNPVRAGTVTQPGAYPWSSYRATAGLATAPEWLTTDWILEQFGRTRRVAQRHYRRFVAEGIKQGQSPWEQVTGQVFLGREAFLRRVQRAARQQANDPEIPQRQRRPAWLSPETVLQKVARQYGLAVAELRRFTHRPSEARQVALYGLRRWAGVSLAEIGKQMGLSYAGVSRRVSAVAQRLAADQRFREQIRRLSDAKFKT